MGGWTKNSQCRTKEKGRKDGSAVFDFILIDSSPVLFTMASHSMAAAKRLRKELQNLERNKDEEDDVYLRPTNPEQSILQWTALLKGPKETPYEGGVFQLSIRCGSDYPLAPPTITFLTKVCGRV